jgi:hypothetical protein
VFVRPLSEPVRHFSSCSTDFSQHIAQVVLFLFLRVFSFKTVGQLQVIHQPFYCPKQIRAGEYAVGRKLDWKGLMQRSSHLHGDKQCDVKQVDGDE